jgi:vacuolar-type H+-ATPase subunit I/STV1
VGDVLAIEHPWVFWPLAGWLLFLLVWAGAGGANVNRPTSTRVMAAMFTIGLILIAVGLVWFVIDLMWWSATGEWRWK